MPEPNISPQIQQAMTRHLQGSLPTNLKPYAGGYVPPALQRQFSDQVQKNLPPHLKQYAGAYMEQQTNSFYARPSGQSMVNRQATDLPSRPPIPNPKRLDHSLPVGEQFKTSLGEVRTGGAQASSDYPTQPTYGPSSGSPYDFITEQPHGPGRSPFSSSSMGRRLAVALIGLAFLAFLIIGGLSILLNSNKGDVASLTTIAQKQYALADIASIGTQKGVSESTQDAAYNIQLSVNTDESALTTYIAQHGKKLSPKFLAQTESQQTLSQLQDAITSSTFDGTFADVMQNLLSDYSNSLVQTYNTIKNPTEKQMLSNDYANTQLLLQQIKTLQSS